MPKAIFRGVKLRYHDQRIKENQVFHRLYFSADFSEPVCEALDWNPGVARDVEQCKLPPRVLSAGLAVLAPNPKPLREHSIEFGYQEIRDFQVHAKHDDEGEYTGAELRFVVVSGHKDLAAYLENWLRAIGTGEGADAQLKVSYAEQTKFEEEGESQPEQAAAGPENIMPDISRTGAGRKRKPTAEASVQ